jgi:hypothetical protein
MKGKGMKRIFGLVMCGILASVFMLSCASLQYVQKDEDVLKLIELINRGESETLTKLSLVPFLLDGEILMLKGDAGRLWENLKNSGFRLNGAAVAAIEPVSDTSFSTFSDSMEVEVYFKKYVPESAKIAHVEAEGVSCTMILNGKDEGFPMIMGLKVQ